MKLIKQIMRYCAKCNAHTTHSVKKHKAKKASTLCSINRRKSRLGRGNHGKFSKTPAQKNKTKRVNIEAKCAVCTRTTLYGSRRTKRIDFIKCATRFAQ